MAALHGIARIKDIVDALEEDCGAPSCPCTMFRRHVQRVHPEIWAFYLLTREAG